MQARLTERYQIRITPEEKQKFDQILEQRASTPTLFLRKAIIDLIRESEKSAC